MDWAVFGKLVVEAVAAAAVLLAAGLFLKDRRQQQRNGLRDRADERQVSAHLAENALAHSRQAMEKVASSVDRASDTTVRLTQAIERMADNCPCGNSQETPR